MRKARRRGAQWAVVVCLLGIFMLAALPVAASQLYTDPNGTFQIAVPDGWQQQQPSGDSTVAEFATADNSAILFLDDQTITAGTSSLAFYTATTQALPNSSGYQLNGTSNVISNGGYQPAIDYTVTNRSGVRVRVRQAFIASGTDGWTLTLAAVNNVADQYTAAFTTAARSFTTTPGAAPLPMQPAVMQPPMMQLPGRAATGGIPTGHYACLTSYSGSFAGGFTFNANGTYTVDEQAGVGMYRFDPTTSQITFTSGPYASDFSAVYENPGTPTIHLHTVGASSTLDCQPGQ